MKPVFTILITCAIFVGCNHASTSNEQDNKGSIAEKPMTSTVHRNFFPVTDFIKGQLTEIRNKGINPVKIVMHGSRPDSSWVKIEDMEKEAGSFLTPVIDSVNLVDFFAEKSFLDQTINAFTFTYDPVKPLPDSFSLQRWDVYIDPESSKVTRIYMVKKLPGKKIQQLTWRAGKSCKMITLTEKPDGSPLVESDVMLNWDF